MAVLLLGLILVVVLLIEADFEFPEVPLQVLINNRVLFGTFPLDHNFLLPLRYSLTIPLPANLHGELSLEEYPGDGLTGIPLF